MKKILIAVLSTIFNRYFDIYTKGRKRLVFFDIDETCPQLRLLENNIQKIKGEVLKLSGSTELMRYHDLDKLQYNISAVENPEKDWKVFMLYMMGEFSSSALVNCPETCQLLKQVPGIYQCFFSVLDPRKNIPAHHGSYRGYLRYHLGLRVPEVNPPFIRIKDQFYTWKNHESVLFDDSWNHEVLNECDDRRIILVVDIYRPLPRIPAKVNFLLTKFLIKKFYAAKILKKL